MLTVLGSDIDGGSTDTCGIAIMDVSPSTFTCADVGDVSVTLTVYDPSMNSATCTTTVTIVDDVPLTAVCQTTTVFLDTDGMMTLDPMFVDGGSMDNCGIADLSVTPSTFTCADLGQVIVTLTATNTSNGVGDLHHIDHSRGRHRTDRGLYGRHRYFGRFGFGDHLARQSRRRKYR